MNGIGEPEQTSHRQQKACDVAPLPVHRDANLATNGCTTQ